MYSKLALFVASAFAVGALAAPGGDPAPAGSTNVSQCNVGTQHCCHSVQNADDHGVQNVAGLLGIPLGGITGQVGLTCTSVLGGNSCTAQPVCCTGNNFSGLIVVGCSPINVGL